MNINQDYFFVYLLRFQAITFKEGEMVIDKLSDNLLILKQPINQAKSGQIFF